MAGLKLATDLAPDKALKAAWRAAQDQGFDLDPLTDGARHFTARKGRLLWSLLAGPLAPNCRFRISVESYDSGTEIVLEESRGRVLTGAVTGALGLRHVHRQASDLATAIADGLLKEGGRVLERKEF